MVVVHYGRKPRDRWWGEAKRQGRRRTTRPSRTASPQGRAYISELTHGRGSSHLNYAVYHDRYKRTPEGWKFTERVYEVRYLDTTPLTGSAPHSAGALADPQES